MPSPWKPVDSDTFFYAKRMANIQRSSPNPLAPPPVPKNKITAIPIGQVKKRIQQPTRAGLTPYLSDRYSGLN